MPFVPFVEKGAVESGSPMGVSLSQDGFCYLNVAAAQAFGPAAYILFLYDEETQTLGFRPATKEEPGAYKLTYLGAGRSCTMKKVLRHYGYDLATIKGRHPVSRTAEGIFVIEIAHPTTPVAAPLPDPIPAHSPTPVVRDEQLLPQPVTRPVRPTLVPVPKRQRKTEQTQRTTVAHMTEGV